MAGVPAAELVIYIAVSSEGWTAVSTESVRDAADRLVDEHGHGEGIRTVRLQMLVELPRARRLEGLIPEGHADVVLPITADTINRITNS